MKKSLLKYIIIFTILIIILKFVHSLRNPLAVYCQYGGGIFYENSSGEYCIVNGIAFNAIDYYNGNVPPQYSFCAHYNLTLVIENITIGNSTISLPYCEYQNGTKVLSYDLIPQNAYTDLIIQNISQNITTIQKESNNNFNIVYIILGIVIAAVVIYIILR